MAQTQSAEQTLLLSRRLNAPPEAVFDAWTDPASLRAWFQPGTVDIGEIVCDARVGGTFRIVLLGAAGEMVHEGTFAAVERPSLLAFTWRSHATDGADTLVTIEFKGQGDGTELILTHERLPNQQSADRHKGGWTNVLDTLGRHLSS